MLESVERFGKDIIPSKDHDDWQILVYESQNAVLELSGHDRLAMKIRDFLDLESA